MNPYEDDSLVFFAVPFVDVANCDVGAVLKSLSGFLSSRKIVLGGYGRISLSFDGYDDDPRDVYAIPEVRQYVSALDAKFPYWFYFVNPETSTLKLLALCLCRLVKVQGGTKPDSDDFKRFLTDHLLALNTLCEQFKLDNKVNKMATDNALKSLTGG